MFANETFRGKTTVQVAITQNKNSFQFAGPKITATYNVAILRMHSRSFYGDVRGVRLAHWGGIVHRIW